MNKDLQYVARALILDQCNKADMDTDTKQSLAEFVLNKATYEQLLNLAFNPKRETDYLSAEVIEGTVLKDFSKKIGNKLATKIPGPTHGSHTFFSFSTLPNLDII